MSAYIDFISIGGNIMKKKVVSLMLVLAMTASMTACGGNKANSADTDADSVANTEEVGGTEEAGAGAAAQYSFHAGQSQRFDAANLPGGVCAERNRPAHPGAAGRDRPPGEREPDAGHEAAGDVHREKCGTI